MAQRFDVLLESFSAGEVSPLLRGRVDTQPYSQGCETITNFIVLPQGGITRREGSQLGAFSVDQENRPTLMPYIYDSDTSYMIEFNDGVFDVYQTGDVFSGDIELVLPDSGGDPDSPDARWVTVNANPYFYDVYVTNVGTRESENATMSHWVLDTFGDENVTGNPITQYYGTWKDTGTDTAPNGVTDGVISFDWPDIGDPQGQSYTGLIRQKLTYLDDELVEHSLLTPGTYRLTIRTSDDGGSRVGNAVITPDLVSAEQEQEGVNTIADNAIVTTAAGTEIAGPSGTRQVSETFTVTEGEADTFFYLYGDAFHLYNTDVQVDHILVERLVSRGKGAPEVTEGSVTAIGPYINNDILVNTGRPMRLNPITWEWSYINLAQGPFYDITHEDYGGLGGNDITLSTAGGAVGTEITITASAALFVSTDASTDKEEAKANFKGRLLRIRPSSTTAWGVGRIVEYASTTSVTVEVLTTIASCTNTDQWRLGAWSDTTGWPQHSTIHQQRMVYANTTDQPQTFWGSHVGQYENFAPDDGSAQENITDLTSYTFTLDTRYRETIQWLLSKDHLLLATDRSVYQARAVNLDETLSSRNVIIRKLAGVGATNIDPIVSHENILFIHYFQRQLLEMAYNFSSDRFEPNNLHIFAEHITDVNPIVSLAAMDYPYRLIWTALDDGKLASMTASQQTGVNAWAQHTIAGEFSSGDAVVESVAVKPGTTQDELWIAVKRTIDGETVRTIEMIPRAQTSSATRSDGKFLDGHVRGTVTAGALVINNSAVDDLSHLEGETVTVMRNNLLVGTDTVTTGELTTTNFGASPWVNGDSVTIGLPYTSTVVTNALSTDPREGRVTGYDSRVVETTLRLWNSLSGSIGSDSDNMDPLQYPSDISVSDNTDLFGGDIVHKPDHKWDRNQKIRITTSDPYPFTITLLINKLVSGIY